MKIKEALRAPLESALLDPLAGRGGIIARDDVEPLVREQTEFALDQVVVPHLERYRAALEKAREALEAVTKYKRHDPTRAYAFVGWYCKTCNYPWANHFPKCSTAQALAAIDAALEDDDE